jgi:5'-3' exonuclease
MLATLIRTRGPDRVVCAMDADWRPAWRVALVASYKAHRQATDGGEQVPADLTPQVPILVDVLAAIGIATVGVAGHEADDVFGTHATREPGPGEVAPGDPGRQQLNDDARGVRVLYCGRGVARLEVFDDAMVRARYGVPAHWYADLATLRGDPSDGLPGVAGVGEKTAARLLTAHGGLAGLLAALADPGDGRLAAGIRARLAAADGYLAAARQVTAVRTDVPVGVVDAALPPAPSSPAPLDQLAERFNLTGPVRRLTAAMVTAGSPGR